MERLDAEPDQSQLYGPTVIPHGCVLSLGGHSAKKTGLIFYKKNFPLFKAADAPPHTFPVRRVA